METGCDQPQPLLTAALATCPTAGEHCPILHFLLHMPEVIEAPETMLCIHECHLLAPSPLTFPKPLSVVWSSPDPEHTGTIGSCPLHSRGKILCLFHYPRLSGLISCWK